MDSRLGRTVLTMRDLQKQPDTQYVLVIAGPTSDNYVAVDDVTIINGVAKFWRNQDRDGLVYEQLVYACRADAQWSMLHRSVVELPTIEDILRNSEEDAKKMKALHKEMHGADCKNGESDMDGRAALPSPGQYV